MSVQQVLNIYYSRIFFENDHQKDVHGLYGYCHKKKCPLAAKLKFRKLTGEKITDIEVFHFTFGLNIDSLSVYYHVF